MKIPVKWLSEYVDLKGFSEAEISNALTMSGTENEIVKGADFPNIVVGEIKEITDHPDADRLHVTKTDVGKEHGGTLQIVCGAPNIEVGQKVPVALVGAMIGEFEIKKAKIRGVESNGMLCSESELGISEDHDGIMILDPRAKIGAPLSEALNIGGTVLEAEITPNRSDCFSIIGVAGEAAAALNRKTKNRNFSKAEVSSKKKVEVKVAEKKLCMRYIAKVVEGIKIGPSPDWMQERLEACGVRPINNIVDVTNYVMLEWGQPMHAFDLGKVSSSNGKCQIEVRLAKKGEEIETLDGIKRKLTEKDLVIADGKMAIGIAGVMGGLNSEVDEKSKDIVLEAAVFDGTSVRKTAQRLGLRTEASNRFEKGMPLGLPELAIERAAGLLAEIAAGTAGENTDVQNTPVYPRFVGLPFSRVKDFLGVEITLDRTLEILTSLGFTASKFDFKKEARSHVGKPYVLGARYSTHGDMAFDCSYLTDFIYRKISRFVGHTALGQFELGQEVKGELQPGDLLFVAQKGLEKTTDEYYVTDLNGKKTRVLVDPPKEVGHVGIYIGDDRVIHAHMLEYDAAKQKWVKSAKNHAKVEEGSVEIFTKNPEYLGARRFIADPLDWISVEVPWWRLDVKIEEDLLEEIGRIYGYENIPGRLPEGKLPVYESNGMLDLSLRLKNILVGAGYSEVYNYSFVSAKNLEAIGQDPKSALKIANPISPEQEYMRLSLTPSLLKNIAVNQFNYDGIQIFEIAFGYLPEKGHVLPREELQLGIAVRSSSRKSGASFFEAKGALELLAQKLGIKKIKTDAFNMDGSNSGQAIKLGTSAGTFAEIFVPNQKMRGSFGIKTEVAVALVNLEKLKNISGKQISYQPVSRFPQVVRDFNFVLNKKIAAAEIESVLESLTIQNLKKIEIIDIYQGRGLSDSEKSVTIRAVLAAEKTLTEDEISAAENQVILAVQKRLKGQLRG